MHDWDLLRAFLSVARTGTVSKAAREQGISHATLLRKIDLFEKELGVKLFKRLQRGYQLTDEGENLFHEAVDIEKLIERVGVKYHRADQEMKGKIRVTQPDNDLLGLYRIYADFCRAYPDIRLQVIPTMEKLNMNAGEADVAIRLTTAPDELLVGRQLSWIDSLVRPCVSKKYQMRMPSSSALSDYEWVIWHHPHESLEDCKQYRWITERVENPRIIMHTSSISGLLGALEAGVGAGFVSPALMYDQGLEFIGTEGFAEKYTLWILCHREMRDLARVRCFMRFLYERLHRDFHANTERA